MEMSLTEAKKRIYYQRLIPIPKHYICYKITHNDLKVDGNIYKPEWEEVPWTDTFLDIEGPSKPTPRFETQAKMRYDDNNFYVAALLKEPHIVATLTEKNSMIYKENDFEVFFDPSWSSHRYTEFEINALNTIWGLLLINPYRDSYNIVNPYPLPGLISAVKIQGTLNDPSDTDESWAVEIAFPWDVLRQFAGSALKGDFKKPQPPENGDQWRINFSRVEWKYDIIDGKYVKLPGPEDNWVWSPQWEIAMHKPEAYGIVQFSSSQVNSDDFIDPVARLDIQNLLLWIYTQQKEYKDAKGVYASSYAELLIDYGSLYSEYSSKLTSGIELWAIEPNSVYGWVASIIYNKERYYVRGDSKQWKEKAKYLK